MIDSPRRVRKLSKQKMQQGHILCFFGFVCQKTLKGFFFFGLCRQSFVGVALVRIFYKCVNQVPQHAGLIACRKKNLLYVLNRHANRRRPHSSHPFVHCEMVFVRRARTTDPVDIGKWWKACHVNHGWCFARVCSLSRFVLVFLDTTLFFCNSHKRKRCTRNT